MLSGTPKPLERLSIILGYPRAVSIHQSEAVLRIRHALVGGEAIPPDRLSIVLRDASTKFIVQTELVLRIGVLLVGREPIPPYRFDVVIEKRRSADDIVRYETRVLIVDRKSRNLRHAVRATARARKRGDRIEMTVAKAATDRAIADALQLVSNSRKKSRA